MNFNIRSSPIFTGIAIESDTYKFLLYIGNAGINYNSLVMDRLFIDGVDIIV